MNDHAKNRTKFIKCACYGHLLEIEHDTEFNQYNLSIWQYGNDVRPLSIKDRIRWIWRLIRTGHLWADEIVLTEAAKKELVDFLNERKNEKTLLHG
jgi:hypothetical protein